MALLDGPPALRLDGAAGLARLADAGIPTGALAEPERSLAIEIAVDRDARGHMIVVASAGAEPTLRLSIDPLTGPMAHHGRRLAGSLGLEGAQAKAVADLVGRLYAFTLAEDAIALRVDPVEIDRAGALACRSAAFALDRMAAFRHPDWNDLSLETPGTSLEQQLMAAGAVGAEIDLDGDIAAVVSGAGLMMASLDILVARGGRVRLMVDMQGLPLQGAEGLAPLIEPAAALRPKVMFYGGRFNAPVTDGFARTVVGVHRKLGVESSVYVWVDGNKVPEAQTIFAEAGFTVCDTLEGALAQVVAAAAG
ncbi:MAG: hypothetical protein HOH66_17310 [Rhodospirillaceae bacterium]|nr:hypothetical protein [Rhodospirillaceae bacterium]MBT6119623.1 hypothetical protein [Rhodospirillaceae bacterium]